MSASGWRLPLAQGFVPLGPGGVPHRHPLATHPLDTPSGHTHPGHPSPDTPRDTPPVHPHGHQADSENPTGILSCFN